MTKLGLFSLKRGWRGEQVLSSTILEEPDLHFSRMRNCGHKVPEGKFQLDIRKKIQSKSGWALEQAAQKTLEKALSNLI